MNRSLLAALALVFPLVAQAQPPAAREIQADNLSVRVGEQTGVPLDGAEKVFIGDVDVAEVATEAGSPYLTIRGLKAGHTKVVLHRSGSNTSLVYEFSVR